MPAIFEELSKVEKTEGGLELSVLEDEKMDVNESNIEINEHKSADVDLIWIILLGGVCLAIFISIIVLKNRNNKQ